MTDHTQKINDAIVSNQPLVFRENLTASSWSHCDRALWLTLRNCSDIEFKAETLRTFKMGHVLEDCIINWLTDAGYKISHQQAEVKNKWNKPLGHIDGIIFSDKKYRLLEIKTSAAKYFSDWIKNGVPEKYRAQAQLYCHHSNQLSASGRKLDEIMWVVLNKNTSEIYIDIQQYDPQYAQLQTTRIENVIESESLPNGEYDYRCNMCNHKAVCKGEKVAQISCRSCAHVSVVNGSFECAHGYGRICHEFVFHPQLIEALGYKLEDIDHESQALVFDKFALAREGVKIEGKPTFTSEEFSIAHPAGLVHDTGLMALKYEFDGTISEVEKK